MSVFLRKQNLKKVFLSLIEAFYNPKAKNALQCSSY